MDVNLFGMLQEHQVAECLAVGRLAEVRLATWLCQAEALKHTLRIIEPFYGRQI